MWRPNVHMQAGCIHLYHAAQVLDAIALNCGREVRAYLASPKWMRRYVQNCLERSFTARATAQLMVNWEHIYKCAWSLHAALPIHRSAVSCCSLLGLIQYCALHRGEELGAAAHATRRQVQAAMGVELPKPNHFARQMRELVEQRIPLIAFQRGMDFPAAFLPEPAATQPQPAQATSTSPGGWLGFGGIRVPGAQHAAPVPAHTPSPVAPLRSQVSCPHARMHACVCSTVLCIGGCCSPILGRERAHVAFAHQCMLNICRPSC